VGEGFWNHLAARHPLQAIVADRGGRVQTFLRVARFEYASRCRVVTPDAGETIGLQLQANGSRV
jgi:hypothetical protein